MRRDRAFWYVLGALALVYVVALFGRGRAASLGPALLQFVISMLALVLGITVHECAHAWAADRLGDPTARLAGRVTLNPLAHLDPLGSFMMVLSTLTGVGIGWGKPTPVAPYRLRFGPRRGNALVALSGPLSNIAVAVLFGLLLRLVPALPLWVAIALNSIVLVNLYLAVFNLLPIPPLDGHSILLGLLSLSRARWAWRVSEFLVRVEQQGVLILFGLIIVTQFLGFPLLGWVVSVPAGALYRLIVG